MEQFWARSRLLGPIIGGGISILVAIFEAFHLSEDLSHDPGRLATISLIYLFGIITLVFGFSVFQIITTIRKERYANVTVHIHTVLHNVRNLMTYMDEQSENAPKGRAEFELFQKTVREQFIVIMDGISQLFSMITGTTCRACIKTIFEKDRVPYLQRFARDKRSFDKHRSLDENRKQSLMDPLQLNSEFKRMMQIKGGTADQWHFICNNIAEAKNNGFHSTSDAAYAPAPLPYRSTVCSAIGQAKAPEIQGPSTIVIGFLAVDSESRNVFSGRWDVELIYAFADALFHPLDRYLRTAIKASENGFG